MWRGLWGFPFFSTFSRCSVFSRFSLLSRFFFSFSSSAGSVAAGDASISESVWFEEWDLWGSCSGSGTMGQIFTGDVGDAGVVSQVTGHGERGAAVAEEAAWGGVMAADPWLFSERDVRLMRLKKPLFLDSRFLSDPSWVLVDEPFPEGILEMIKMRKSKFIQSQKWIWCQTCSNYKKTLTNMTNWIWEMITLMSQKKGKTMFTSLWLLDMELNSCRTGKYPILQLFSTRWGRGGGNPTNTCICHYPKLKRTNPSWSHAGL